MEPNFEFHDINIADIWPHEQSLFLDDKSSLELASKIVDKTEAIIINKGSSSFGIEYRDSKNENERRYYLRNEEDYILASKSLYSRFNIDYFFNKNSCFQYEQSILVNKENIDFDFWFSLKLRQYDTKLSEIKNFLSSQLLTNFNSNRNEFVDFLNICIRQYQSELFKKRLIDTVNDWVAVNSNFKSAIASDESDDSFDEMDENLSGELILNINYDQSRLLEVLKPYFENKDQEKLKSLLNKEEIENKICFRSNANQLVMIFRQLHIHQRITGTYVNTEKWICKYFTYCGMNKKSSNFNAENVHNILKKKEYNIPKSKRIDLPGLEYIKNKSE